MPEVETLPDDAAAADAALLAGEEPEQPAEEPVADAAEPQPDEPSGQPRDPQGRFTDTAPTPEPETPVDGAAVPDSETPGEPQEEAQAWSIHAEGSDFQIEGAVVGDDGVFIPAAQRERTETLIRQGLAYEGSSQTWFNEANQRQQETEQRAESALAQVDAAVAEKQHVLDHFEQLVEASQAQLAQGAALADTPLGQWMVGVAVNWPVLKAQAETRGLQVKAEVDSKRVETFDREREDAKLQPVMDKALSDWVLSYGEQAGLDRAVLEGVYKDLKDPRFKAVLFVRSPRDDVSQGIRKGDLAIDHTVVGDWISRVVGWRGSGTATTAAGAPTPAAPAKPAPTPPPTVSATRGPAPQKAPPAAPKTKEQADDELLYGTPDE